MMRSTNFIIIILLSCLLSFTHSSPDYATDVQRLTEKQNRSAAMDGDIVFESILEGNSGYISVSDKDDAEKLFYYFFARNTTAQRVVLWLSGGAGVSTNIAVFYENGPFRFDERGFLIENLHGWNHISNIIYVEQPIGTGFSYEKKRSNIRDNQVDIANDLYYFLQNFFKRYHAYSDMDFFITGEGYAAHYASALALKILQENNNINLQGVAIGNPLIDLGTQYATIPDFAFDLGRITENDYIHTKHRAEVCKSSTLGDRRVDGKYAYQQCDRVRRGIMSILKPNIISDFDIREPPHQNYMSSDNDYSKLKNYLDRPDINDVIGATSITRAPKLQSSNVLEALEADYARNIHEEISTLLKGGIKFLSYAGVWDLRYNHIGIMDALLETEWSGHDGFANSSPIAYMVDNNNVGLLKTHGKLSYIKVHHAGRKVSSDQPRVASEIIRRWMDGEY